MKEIRVADQPRMGLRAVMRMAADGIRHRLFRSGVTVVVIAVAVAFLLNIVAESLIRRGMGRQARAQLTRTRLVHAWVAQLTAPAAPEMMLRDLAHAVPGDAFWVQTARMGHLSDVDMTTFRAAAQQATATLDLFRDMNYADRRRIVGPHRGVALLDYLATPEGLEHGLAALRRTRSVRLPVPEPVLRRFLDEWPGTRERIDRVRRGQQAAIDVLAAQRGNGDVLAALTEVDAPFGQRVRDAGFSLDAEYTAPQVARQARRALLSAQVERSVTRPSVRRLLAAHYAVLPGQITVAMLWRYLADRERADAYRTVSAEHDHEVMPDADQLMALAAAWQEAAWLARTERLTADAGSGWLGLGPRMAWLLSVAMLVCAIGIANAMLMTVTERFQEIATLKCLGALDGTIMQMFVVESALMGVVGGLLGGCLGTALGLGRMLVMFGFAGLPWLPALSLLKALGLSVAAGIILAAVAAVYPSFRAARLAPMEAMRIQ